MQNARTRLERTDISSAEFVTKTRKPMGEPLGKRAWGESQKTEFLGNVEGVAQGRLPHDIDALRNRPFGSKEIYSEGFVR